MNSELFLQPRSCSVCQLEARIWILKNNCQYVRFANPYRQFEKFVVTFVVKKNKSLILLGKYGSAGRVRTYDWSVIPGHKVSQSVIFIRV